MNIPFSIENQTGSSIVLLNNTILNGETFFIPLNVSFYNDTNAGVLNIDFTDITILNIQGDVMGQPGFYDSFNDLQNQDSSRILSLDNSEEVLETISAVALKLKNEEDRDLLFPNPSNNQSYYNKRLEVIERFDSSFGLWLNSHLIVVQNTAGLPINRFIQIDSSNIVDSFEYPTLKHATTTSDRKYDIGVLVQNGTGDFSSVAVSGKYYVEYATSILIREYVRSRTNGTNSDIGMGEGVSTSGAGVVGFALQNSGATVGKPDLILINIDLTASL